MQNDIPIIEVKNLGKKYNINHQRGGYIALRDVIAGALKSPFRFLRAKAREATGRSKEEFWALKDVNFTVQKGEMIGIIGMNGAGKSTMLKILSQITPPTTGEITIRGHVGSLLEVGTGFHPELTGRENIFLNGAILGMTRKEIVSKFDQIVEFSGVEKFLDTPVKYYSSGMYVRLAFSVAAHMEPDILIVDEVLAVGDAEFQKKCLGKMEQVTKQEGRTVLFVSHNMAAIESLCQRVILLEHGHIAKIGPTKEVVDAYFNRKTNIGSVSEEELKSKVRSGAGNVEFTEVRMAAGNSEHIKSHDILKITMKYKANTQADLSNPRVMVSIYNSTTQQMALRMDSTITKNSFGDSLPSQGTIMCETNAINLKAGRYIVTVDFNTDGVNQDHIDNVCEFNVETDIAELGYKVLPDKHTPDHLIEYSFIIK